LEKCEEETLELILGKGSKWKMIQKLTIIFQENGEQC
jgi:hypothetical protein